MQNNRSQGVEPTATKRSRRLLVAVAVTAAIVVLVTAFSLFPGHQLLNGSSPADPTGVEQSAENGTSPTSASTTGLQVPASANVTDVRDTKSSMIASVYTASRARDAMAEAVSDPTTDAFIAERMKFVVSSTCDSLDDRTAGMLMHEQADPSRKWTAVALYTFCDGWDAKEFPADAAVDSPESMLSLLRRLGPDATADAAISAITTESTAFELFEAAQFLNEHGRMPTPRQLGIADPFGPMEQSDAMMLATSLVECSLAQACGSNSLTTLNYCLNFGCVPQSGYLDALRQNVSPAEFQLINAYYNWILAQRRAAGG